MCGLLVHPIIGCMLNADSLDDVIKMAHQLDRGALIRWYTVDDVAVWAESNGGELGVRNDLAAGVISQNEHARLAKAWLAHLERERADAQTRESMEIGRRAAVASERAARYAMWSAAISAAVGILSGAAYWIARTSP